MGGGGEIGRGAGGSGVKGKRGSGERKREVRTKSQAKGGGEENRKKDKVKDGMRRRRGNYHH